LPVPLQLVVCAIDGAVFLVDVGDAFLKSGSEALGREVEADGDDAEETETRELDGYADLSDSLAFVGFGDGVCLAGNN